MYDFDARNEILHETHFSLLPLSPSVFLAMFAETETLFHPRFTSEHTARRLSRFSTLRAPMIYFPIIYVLPPTRIPGTARVDRSRVGRSAWRIQGVGGAGARARYPESLVADARQRETGSKVIQRRKERSVTDLAGVRGRRERRQGREKEEREATGAVARERRGEKGGNRVVSEYRSTRAIFTDKGRRCNLLGLRYTSIHRAFIYPLASRYMPLPCVYSFTSLLSPFSPCPRILRHSLSTLPRSATRPFLLFTRS